MLQIETVDGRVYRAILKPAKAVFVIPRPATPMRLLGDSLLSGLQRVLLEPTLWALLFIIGGLRVGWRPVATGALVFSICYLIAQSLANRLWLTVDPSVPIVATALTVLLPALGLATGGEGTKGWVRPFWVISGLLGLLFGGAFPETLASDGLSRPDQILVAIGFNLGVGVGLLLIVAIAFEFRHIVLKVLRIDNGRFRTALGYVFGTICFGLFLYKLEALLTLKSPLEKYSLEAFLFVVVFGMWLRSSFAQRWKALPAVIVLFGSGLAAGFNGLQFPWPSLTLSLTLFILGVLLLIGKRSLKLGWVAGAMGVFYQGWFVGSRISEDMTLPIANVAGAGLLVLTVFYFTLNSSGKVPIINGFIGVRLFGGVVAALAVIWRAEEYIQLLKGPLSTELALGYISVPILGMVLVGSALLTWPRKRRIVEELGVQLKRPMLHWVLVGAAFFAFPVGTLRIARPFFEPHAPTGGEAERVLSQVLSDTYKAFNMRDEGEQYDRLSESVTGGLVANIYLDSRRRLISGTREGAQVTVRDVRLISLGDEVEGNSPEEGFAYTCRWVVTARVQHLQHVHHRQNIYNGILKIRIDEDRWKIFDVELKSEERVILPWQTT